MTLCQKCVMRVPKGETLCKECKTFTPVTIDWKQQEAELRQLLDAYKGRGKYDVIVPLTGGKDSSFVLYYMTKIMGARVLAFTWDNLLIREGAWENIRNAVKATGVKHKIFKWDDDLMLKLHRATFKHYATICYCPVYMAMSIFPVAIAEQVPLIISGFSEGQRELNHSWKMPTQEEQKAYLVGFFETNVKYFTYALDTLNPKDAEVIKDCIFSPLMPYVQPDSQVDFYPVMLPLANYVRWVSIEDLENTLGEQLNWKRPADTYMHTSCIIEPIRGYIECRKNLNEMPNEISNLIRIGAITREEGLREVQLMNIDGTVPDLTAHNRFLGITDEDFFEAIRQNETPRPELIELRNHLASAISWIKGIKNIKAISI